MLVRCGSFGLKRGWPSVLSVNNPVEGTQGLEFGPNRPWISAKVQAVHIRARANCAACGSIPRPGGEPGFGESWHHQAVDDPTEDRESAYELLQRGDDLLRSRHFAAAAIVLERASRAEPGKQSILEALGRAYYNSGQHEASRATFEALLELDPSAHYAHFALGQSLKQLGRSKEARTHLRLAVALSPNSTLYAGALARLGPPAEG
jgi:tetratricopeptide (TPR) repeat protein